MFALPNKDVLGPTATIVAAVVAAVVTIIFQSRQHRTAKNKLKIDLFDKKYKIYNDTKSLLSLVLNDCHDIDRIRDNTNLIRSYYITMNESRFFFSRSVVVFLSKCEKDCEAFLMAISMKENITDNKYKEHAEHIGGTVAALRADYAALPAKFESDLRIES